MNTSEGGTHGMTKRLKGYTRQKWLGTTALDIATRSCAIAYKTMEVTKHSVIFICAT